MINLSKKETFIKIGAFLLFVLSLKYLTGFIFTALISAAVAAISLKITSRFVRLPFLKKIFSVIFVLLIYALVVAAVSIAAREIYSHAADFCSELISNTEKLSSLINAVMSAPARLAEKITGTDESALFGIISSALKNAATDIVGKVPSWLAAIAAKVPQILFYFISTVLAGVYFCADGGKMLAKIAHLPIVCKIKKIIPSAAGTYCALSFLTFAELFLGLSIVGVKYSVLLAFFIALVDAMPILGASAVLIPWAAVEAFSADTARAAALVVIWIIVALTRQLVEPKLVGDGLGISPLLSIMSVCLGFCLFGALGAVVAPFIAFAVKLVFGEKTNEALA